MKKGFVALALGMLLASVVAVACSTGSAGGGVPEACNGEGGCASFKTGEVIKIGVGGPMTGDNSAFGIDAYQAGQMAVKEAADFNGRTFGVEQGDDLGTGEGGAAVANKFVADQAIVAVMGHSFSGASSNAMPIYAGKFIPMMSESATNVDLSKQGNISFNRLVPTDKVQGIVDADFLAKNLGATKVAIIHDGTTYGQPLAQGVSDNLEAAGVEVVAFEAINPGETDYSAVLTKIAALSPEAVFFGGYQPEAAVLAGQKGAAGLDVPFVSGDGVFGTQFLELSGDNGEGYYVTQPGAPESDARSKFDAAYEAEFGAAPGSLSGYTWFAYDATNLLIEKIKAVAVVSGDTLYIPRKALVDAVRGTKDFKGLTGTVTCDATGECALPTSFLVFQVQQGAFAQLPADYKP
jgi:branched-chain amino acid transport system substrate-binding protein